MTNPQPVGAVLAGGMSRRMGSPKCQLILPDGQMMLQKVIDALQPCCSEVVILGNRSGIPDIDHLEDRHPNIGPLGGIDALLASGRARHYLICPCDMPFLNTSLMQQLAAALPDADAAVFRIDSDSQPRELPLRLHAKVAPIVERQIDAGHVAIRDLLSEIDVNEIKLPQSHADAFININTPDDVARITAQS